MVMKVEINGVARSYSSPVYGGSGPRVIARVEGGDAGSVPSVTSGCLPAHSRVLRDAALRRLLRMRIVLWERSGVKV
jgi:hypothetical protein